MIQDEKDVYEWKSSQIMDYHKRQLQTPYRSTVFFEKFLSENTNLDNCNIVDIACGTGGATKYLAELHKNSVFLGIDFNENFAAYFQEQKNVAFEVGNLYEMSTKYANHFDGALCIQTLSWLPEYKEPLKNIFDLKTNWIALSFLGYEGKINFNIGIENYENLTSEGDFTHSWYNIYSLPLMEEFFRKHGFRKFKYKEFEIDIDPKKSDNKNMGTYTLMTSQNKRIQISGALMMPWYFVYAER